MAEVGMRRRLWEALIAVTLEESVRRFVPVLLPYVWLVILLGLTLEIANGEKLKPRVKSAADKLTRRFGKVTSYFIAAVLGAGLGMFYWWGIQKVQSEFGEEKEGFQVVFKTTLLDLGRNTEDSTLWALYASAYRDTISPVAVLAFLEVTNLRSHNINISNYSLSIKTEACGWVYLSPIPAAGHHLLWGYAGTADMPVINVKNALDEQWKKPVEPHATNFGFLIFDTKVLCPVRTGQAMQLKLEITDSSGKQYTFLSPEVAIRNDFMQPGSTIGQENIASFELTGQSVDATRAHRKIYSDAPPKQPPPDRELGIALTHAGKIGTVCLQDGAYVLSTQKRAAP